MIDHRDEMTPEEKEAGQRLREMVRVDRADGFIPSAKHKAKAAKRREANKAAGKSRKRWDDSRATDWNVHDMWHMECSGLRHLRRGLEEAQEALRTLNVDQTDLELRGMESSKAWRVVYNAKRENVVK